jgi:hypothetical protein
VVVVVVASALEQVAVSMARIAMVEEQMSVVVVVELQHPCR